MKRGKMKKHTNTQEGNKKQSKIEMQKEKKRKLKNKTKKTFSFQLPPTKKNK